MKRHTTRHKNRKVKREARGIRYFSHAEQLSIRRIFGENISRQIDKQLYKGYLSTYLRIIIGS